MTHNPQMQLKQGCTMPLSIFKVRTMLRIYCVHVCSLARTFHGIWSFGVGIANVDEIAVSRKCSKLAICIHHVRQQGNRPFRPTQTSSTQSVEWVVRGSYGGGHCYNICKDIWRSTWMALRDTAKCSLVNIDDINSGHGTDSCSTLLINGL